MASIKFGFVVFALMVANSIGLQTSCPANQCRLNQVLEKGDCVLAVGSNCAKAINGCSFGATCDNGTQTCTCRTGYLEIVKTGTCIGIFGGNCDCDIDCGGGFACIDNKCACPRGTTYDKTKMNTMLGMPGGAAMSPTMGNMGICVVNIGERCDSTTGPTCSTWNCNAGIQRCGCQYPQAFNTTTKKCECTADNTYVDSYGNCVPYSGAACYASDLGYSCDCYNGANGNHKTHNCDTSSRSYW